MRTVTGTTTSRWRQRMKLGDSRARARVTIQPMAISRFTGPEYTAPGDKENTYTSMVFGQSSDVRELPNVKSITIQRSVDQDAQTCTIELWNVDDIPIGATLTAEELANHERPGWFTFNRGDSGNPWGQTTNTWRDWIVPDRIIRTYEGYGINPVVAADKDTNMYLSGVWLIDAISLTPDGSIKVECRDGARELLECVIFIPVVPEDYYPLEWEKRHTVQTGVEVIPGPVYTLIYQSDSNLPYIGKGFTDGSYPYVSSDGSVRGHYGWQAFDGNNETYWLSVGNKSRQSTSAFEWVQGVPIVKSNPNVAADVQAVRVRSWGGPYSVYISVKVDGTWKGKYKIPYIANAVDANTDIKYVKRGKIGRNETKWFKLPKIYEGVEAIRITLHNLYDSNIGTFPYRGGVREVRWSPTGTTQPIVETLGNYDDYADIVKTILAWGGFYWPPASTNRSYIRSSDGSNTTLAQASADPVLVAGNVWGDISETGVGGEDWTKLEAQVWDQKPLMDAIKYVQEIVAYTFFVDETGGAVFRQPNIWQYGNYVSGTNGGPSPSRDTNIITLTDTVDVLGFNLTVSSRNRRDAVFVGNVDGTMGAVARGYNPYPSGTRRVGGWTDQNFQSQTEVEVMAALIAIRQALKFRTATVEIAGYPAIQIDDQIIIQERITGTNHLFYIDGLTNTYDAMTGTYKYQLSLQWLGTPSALVTVADMLPLVSSDAARVYISEMFGV
jgi:hypothetical protein